MMRFKDEKTSKIENNRKIRLQKELEECKSNVIHQKKSVDLEDFNKSDNNDICNRLFKMPIRN